MGSGRDRISRALGTVELDSKPGDGRADDSRTELRRATQAIRSAQSTKALPVVVVCVSLLVLDLWSVVPQGSLLAFAGLLISAAVLRALVCRRIEKRVDVASAADLNVHEWWLFWTALLNSGTMGTGFWLVAGPEEATFDIALACCLYAIGAMINASVEPRPFIWSIGANLGQGLIFAMGLGPKFDPFLGFMLLGLFALLGSFGQVNGKNFRRSFRMREANVLLVKQLNEEKRVVERALERARGAAKEQSRFLAAASHDLRQPLHALNLYLDPLHRQVAGTNAERMVDRIIESSDLLGEQLNSMLDLSRLDAGVVEVDRQVFPVQVLLARIGEDCRADAEGKGLTLRLDLEEADIYTDPVLLDRVVRNLLSNAIRYTEGGLVVVAADVHENQVRVSVRDTGPGIHSEDRARIFEDFVQLENPGRLRSRGVGLGLSSVRRIDQLLDLELQVHSQVGKGSDFIFWVPLAKPSDTHQVSESRIHPVRSLQGMTVWAVDDDENVAEALNLQLRSMGCKALVVSSRVELEREWKKNKLVPDVALIDDMLDGRDSGFDIACWLLKVMPPEFALQKRLILLTGNSDPIRIEQIRAQGFRLIQKPMRAGQLEALLGHLAPR